jgi:hypothetical protein
MSSALELDDLSDKRRASSSPLDVPVDPGPVLLTTNPEDFREGTTASWTWAASGMFVVRLSVDKQSDNLDPQLDILVVCPHILPSHPAIRQRPISTINDATGVFLGLAFRPSISIFGRWPRGQCKPRFIFHPELPPIP